MYFTLLKNFSKKNIFNCQALGIRRRRDSPVAIEDPEDVERRAARLGGGDIGLQPPHTPHVVHNKSHNDHVRPVWSVEGHVVFFCCCFFSYLRREQQEIIAM